MTFSAQERRNRELNPLEAALAGLAEGHAMNAVFAVRIEGNLTGSLIRAALDRIQRGVDTWNVELTRQDGKYFFRDDGVGEVPCRVEERLTDDTWLAIAENELNEPFLPGSPLCRVVLLTSRSGGSSTPTVDLIIAASHAAGDLNSALWLCEDLLEACEALATGKPDFPSPERTFSLITSPMLPSRVTGPGADRLIQAGVRQAEATSRLARYFRPPSPALPDPPKTRLHHRALAPGMVWAMQKAASRRKVSLQVMALTAKLVSAARLISSGDAVHLLYDSVVDVRELFSPPIGPDHVGNLIFLQRFSADIDPREEFWELAGKIFHQVNQLGDLSDILLNALVAERLAFIHEADGAALPPTLGMNCNGIIRFPFNQNRSFRVVGNWSQGSTQGCLSSITEFGGSASWNIAYASARIDTDTATALVDGAVGLLTEILG